jgi:prephenate dehydrogenase
MSRRGTDAKKNKAKPTVLTDPQIQIIRTLQQGVEWANELGKQLQETDAADWDKRKMVIAALVYAAAMSADTGLDEEGWLDMAVMAFRGVEVE